MTPFASKTISTAKWTAPSGLKWDATNMTVTGGIPKETAWTKDGVNGGLSRVDAYSQFAVYYLTSAKQEVFLGFVDATVDALANKVTSASLTELLKNVDKAIVPNKVSFVVRAFGTIVAVDPSDIVNCSLSGKFTVNKNQLS